MNHNPIIKKLLDEDQKDRQEAKSSEDFQKVIENDKTRYSEALSLYNQYKEGELPLSPEDKFNLAMLFQHGSSSEDYQRARELAEESAEEGFEKGRWLACAAEDRQRVNQGKKQIYGTQMKRLSDGTLEPFPIEDSENIDKRRTEKGLESFVESLKKFDD